MKNIALLCLILAGMLTTKVFSQPAAGVAKEKLKPFSNWVGQWSGEGSMQNGPGEPKKTTIREHVIYKLDGTVIQVEGNAKSIDPASGSETVVHNALAILYFDQSTLEYRFNSFLQDGRHADAWFKIVSEDNYMWGFDIPSGKIKYTVTINVEENTWDEIGEFSPDKGTSWFKFFEMKLKKQ